MSPEQLLRANRARILEVAARHGASNVRVFGSFARGEATDESDLDLLVDFEGAHSLLDRAALMVDLKELLGREVDVLTEDSIYWLLRRRILREARAL